MNPYDHQPDPNGSTPQGQVALLLPEQFDYDDALRCACDQIMRLCADQRCAAVIALAKQQNMTTVELSQWATCAHYFRYSELPWRVRRDSMIWLRERGAPWYFNWMHNAEDITPQVLESLIEIASKDCTE